jgi:hypothetical protein
MTIVAASHKPLWPPDMFCHRRQYEISISRARRYPRFVLLRRWP